MPIIKLNKKGFTLVESVIGIAIFTIIFLALVSLFSVIFNNIKNNKAMIAANNLALEQLEIIRGMNFDEVKTDTGWVPAGALKSAKDISRSGINFTVQTDIAFVDDSFDSLDPADTFPYDYKKARVRVLWTNPATGSQDSVALNTNVVPLGMEGLSAGKGGILVYVYNASGVVVPGARVDLTNIAKSYSLLNNLTDLNGNLWIPDLAPSNANPPGDYRIVATKAGYSTAQTYAVDNNAPPPPNPDYNPAPEKKDAVVAVGLITKIGLQIDVLGKINIKTVNYNNPQYWQINSLGADSQTDVDLDIDSGDNIFLVWLGSGGQDRIYAQKYRYNGGTGEYDRQWASDAEFTTSNNMENPRVEVYGNSFFYVVWDHSTSGNKDVYLQKRNSSNGNQAWNEVKANQDAGNKDQTKPDLAVNSLGNVYVVWMDYRNNNWDIYAQKYDAGGNWVNSGNWAAGDLKVNDDAGTSNQVNPRAAVDNNNNLYVAWEDSRNTDKDIYLMKFDSDGNKLTGAGEFGANNKKINTDSSGLDQYDPAMDFDGSDYFYIAWSDQRNSQPDIYAQKVDKNGDLAVAGSWASGDVKINDDSLPTAWRTKPAVAYFSDNSIYFSWTDDRNGDPDVYSVKFKSDGTKLWDYDLRLSGNSSAVQDNPEVIADSMGYAITAWEDNRNGDFDIYAARYKDLGSAGTPYLRTNIPITVHGTKLKGTYPVDQPIYKYLNAFTSNASGEINDIIVEWDNDGYYFLTNTPHTIISTDQPIPLSIAPGETKTIIINVEP